MKPVGADYLAIAADLASIEPVERILDEAVRWAGGADILVNNAGIIRRADPLEFSEKDWDDVINVDLKSVFFLAQAFARRAVARGGGAKIINVASILAQVGDIRAVLYGLEARRRGPDQAARQRMGGQGHQRERDRAGLCAHRRDAGVAGRPGAQ